MKKKIGLLGLLSLFGLGIATTTASVVCEYHREDVVVYAEETTETTETIENTEAVDEVKKWFDEWLSPDKVAMYMSWLAYVSTIIGLAVKFTQLKKVNNLTLKDVSNEVKGALELTIGKEVAKKFDEVIPNVLSTQEKTNQIMSIFAKILALSQENTPESRVAILNLIEQLGTVGQDVVNSAKNVIVQSVQLAEQAKEDLGNKIDEIVDHYDGTSI